MEASGSAAAGPASQSGAATPAAPGAPTPGTSATPAAAASPSAGAPAASDTTDTNKGNNSNNGTALQPVDLTGTSALPAAASRKRAARADAAEVHKRLKEATELVDLSVAGSKAVPLLVLEVGEILRVVHSVLYYIMLLFLKFQKNVYLMCVFQLSKIFAYENVHTYVFFFQPLPRAFMCFQSQVVAFTLWFVSRPFKWT